MYAGWPRIASRPEPQTEGPTDDEDAFVWAGRSAASMPLPSSRRPRAAGDPRDPEQPGGDPESHQAARERTDTAMHLRGGARPRASSRGCASRSNGRTPPTHEVPAASRPPQQRLQPAHQFWKWINGRRLRTPALTRTSTRHRGDRGKRAVRDMVGKLSGLRGISTLAAMVILSEVYDLRRLATASEVHGLPRRRAERVPRAATNNSVAASPRLAKPRATHPRRGCVGLPPLPEGHVAPSARCSRASRQQSPTCVARRSASYTTIPTARSPWQESPVATTAIARELAGFVWAIGEASTYVLAREDGSTSSANFAVTPLATGPKRRILRFLAGRPAVPSSRRASRPGEPTQVSFEQDDAAPSSEDEVSRRVSRDRNVQRPACGERRRRVRSQGFGALTKK